MANAKVVGVDSYVANLDRMSADWEKAADESIYTGAGILADAVRKEIEALPIRSGKVAEGELAYGVTKQEKTALLYGLGIARLRNDDGFHNERIGFDGYDAVKTRMYPKGHPISMIARGVNGGTSWLAKIPFITRAYNKARKQVEAEMQKVFIKELNING